MRVVRHHLQTRLRTRRSLLTRSSAAAYEYTPAGTKTGEPRYDVGSGSSTASGFAIGPDRAIPIAAGRTVSATVDFFTVRVAGTGPAACDPNCDASTAAPLLNVQYFTCFLQKQTAGCP